MIRYVPLAELPEKFAVPDQLRDRFWYDQDKKRLAYDGAMSKATYDRLRGLSSHFNYQRAMEELFRIAVPEDDRPKHNARLIVVATGVAVVAASLVAGFWLWQRTHADNGVRPMETKITSYPMRN